MADLPACLWDRPAHVHLIGMGGVGMAGLARLLIQSGFTVSGSDSHPNRLTRDLEAQGAQFFAGHHPDHPPRQTEWAVRTPAVGEGNPEVEALRERQIPVWVRGQVLASFSNRRRSVAVAGAHGKTTTSAMLATILEHARSGAGYAVGGETGLPGRVADRGSTEAFVLEADESDGTLVHYAPAVGILTHVEWDHVERFRSESSLLRCYRRFAEGCGVRWIREGDLLAEQVSRDLPQLKRVGESTTADLQFLGATESPDGQEVRFGFQGGTYSFRIPLPGRHNAMNALLAVAAAGELGVSPETACAGLRTFEGVGRRFQIRKKRGITLLQDYAHHPTEIRALLQAARALQARRIWLVFQPHRFSRTRHLLSEFAQAFHGADRLALLPVYAASELPEQGKESGALAELCRASFPEVRVFSDRASLLDVWVPKVGEGELVLIVGAGDIEHLQEEWLQRL